MCAHRDDGHRIYCSALLVLMPRGFRMFTCGSKHESWFAFVLNDRFNLDHRIIESLQRSRRLKYKGNNKNGVFLTEFAEASWHPRGDLFATSASNHIKLAFVNIDLFVVDLDLKTPSSYPQDPLVAMSSEEIIPGDIVAVQHGQYGKTEGLVVGSHYDYAGRQIVEVQLEPGNVYHAWYPTVTRVKRTISYSNPVPKHRTLQRTIYW